MTQQSHDLLDLRGQELIGHDGNTLGRVEEIYLDTDTDQPMWALLTTGPFGTEQCFVPIAGASREGDSVFVRFDKATVQDAPKVDHDGRLSDREEQELYRHYGMSRSEEELRVAREPITDANLD
jgi:sporulation protein YlmC with PRC-barrel domain